MKNLFSSFLLSVSIVVFVASYISAQTQWTGTTDIYKTSTSGNVGIGLTIPTFKLDIYNNTTNNVDVLRLAANTDANNEYAGLLFSPKSGREARIVGIFRDLAGSYDGSDLAFYTKPDGPNNPSEKMRILYNGNIGIGTTNPLSRLDVSGGLALGSYAGVNAAPTNGMIVSGNVGVGVTSPSEKLDIQGNLRVRGNINFDGQGVAIRSILTGYGYDMAFDINGISGVKTPMFFSYNSGDPIVRIYNKVGIGISDPGSYKLAVNGTIHAKEVVVDNTGWPDFVFDDNYSLKSLDELESFVKENKHLPEIPSAVQIQKDGVSLGEIQAKLLQKIEELTLYLIELKKENESLKNRVSLLEE